MEKVLYYSSETKDDFAGNAIEHKDLPASYEFFFKNPIARAAAFLLYYLVGLPFGFFFQKIVYREKIVGREKLKPYRKTGYFLYGNHTREAGDAYCPGRIAFPKKAHIIANADCMNIPGIRFMVKAFGAIPIPLSLAKMKAFVKAVERLEGEGKTLGPSHRSCLGNDRFRDGSRRSGILWRNIRKGAGRNRPSGAVRPSSPGQSIRNCGGLCGLFQGNRSGI